MVHQPVPRIGFLFPRRSQLAKKQTPATSNTTPPPKKPAACGIQCSPPATSNANATTVAPTPTRKIRLTFGFSPNNNPRVDPRPTLRNVNNTHTTAATTPLIAPIAIDCHETCSVNAVVPTAPTHHVRKPYINTFA